MAAGPPEDKAAGSPHERTEPGMPRWVKWGFIVIVVVILLIVILVLTGVHQPPPGGHGP